MLTIKLKVREPNRDLNATFLSRRVILSINKTTVARFKK